MTYFAKALLGVCIFSLAACAPLPVKDIASDKEGYLDKFPTEAVHPDVLAQVRKADSSPKAWQTLRVTYEFTKESNNERSDGTKDILKFVRKTVYKDTGNGVEYAMNELIKDEFPVSLRYEGFYKGIVSLASQNINLGAQQAPFPGQIKKFTRLDVIPAKPAEAAEFKFDAQSGLTPQFANYLESSQLCVTGKYYSANTLHPSLKGQAIDFTCTISRNNTSQSKFVLAYLIDYGIAVDRSSANAQASWTYKIREVSFQ
jgi:hypothetical protein